jgi:hypothetical protein
MGPAAPPARSRFLILCLGRSGSTHLQSLLDFHPEIRCYSEPFAPDATEPEAFVNSPETDPVRYLESLEAGRDEPVIGLKLPMNSLRAHPAAIEILDATPAPRLIRLRRANSLALLVSRRLMASTGVSQSIYGGYGDATVEIPPEQCVAALEGIEEDQAELDALGPGHPSFEITYEQLIAGERLVELQRFLGVEPVELRSWFTKLRSRPLSATVSNWNELVEALRGTRFEHFAVDAP